MTIPVPPTRRQLLTMIGKAGASIALYQAAGSAFAAELQPKTLRSIRTEIPTEASVAPYGTMLGKPFPTQEGAVAFRTNTVASWRQHIFDVGKGGDFEIVWVEYHIAEPIVSKLEQHHFTEQAVVPLKGEIVQLLALSGADGLPDPSTLRAFRVAPGTGICMGRDVWHTTRSHGSTCLMLTRGTTSVDILDHRKGMPLKETTQQDIAPVRLADPI